VSLAHERRQTGSASRDDRNGRERSAEPAALMSTALREQRVSSSLEP
jgi:hypothetical protein